MYYLGSPIPEMLPTGFDFMRRVELSHGRNQKSVIPVKNQNPVFLTLSLLKNLDSGFRPLPPE